jgi:hypothetical protein
MIKFTFPIDTGNDAMRSGKSRLRPRRREPSRFDTIPSRPILQACANTSSPSGRSRCSFNRIPDRVLRRMLASVALRTSIGSLRRFKNPEAPAVKREAEEEWGQ